MAERIKRLAPLSGIVFVALVAVSVGISGDTPGVDESPAKVAAYYDSHDGRTIAQVVLLAYAAVFAAVFFTALAQFLRDRGGRTMATLALVGGVFAAVGCGLGAGMNAALGEANSHFGAEQMQVLNAMSEDLFWPIMVGGVVLATLAAGVSMLSTHALPKAVGILTVIVGVVGMSGIGSWFGFMGSGVMLLVISGYVTARAGRPATITLPEVPGQRAETDAQIEDRAGTAG